MDYVRQDAVGEGGRVDSFGLGGAGQGGGAPEDLFYSGLRWQGERGSLWGREVAQVWGEGVG